MPVSHLHAAFNQGVLRAFTKFALNPMTAADAFAAEVDGGKEMPPPGADALVANELAEQTPPPSNPHAPFDLSSS